MIQIIPNTDQGNQVLLDFLLLASSEFQIPLTDKVNLKEYTTKILSNGVAIVFVENNKILSCRTFYCNDNVSHKAYGSIMCTLPEARGKGLAKKLILEMFKICKSAGMLSIISSSVNPIAISLYKSIGYHTVQKQLNDEGSVVEVLEYIL